MTSPITSFWWFTSLSRVGEKAGAMGISKIILFLHSFISMAVETSAGLLFCSAQPLLPEKWCSPLRQFFFSFLFLFIFYFFFIIFFNDGNSHPIVWYPFSWEKGSFIWHEPVLMRSLIRGKLLVWSFLWVSIWVFANPVSKWCCSKELNCALNRIDSPFSQRLFLSLILTLWNVGVLLGSYRILATSATLNFFIGRERF